MIFRSLVSECIKTILAFRQSRPLLNMATGSLSMFVIFKLYGAKIHKPALN